MGLLAALAGWLMLQQPAPVATGLLAGEVVKVDLARRHLVVRSADPPRETAFVVDAVRTRMGCGGRPIALEGIRPGEWVLVAHEAAGLQPLAVLVKVGAVRPSPASRRSSSSS